MKKRKAKKSVVALGIFTLCVLVLWAFFYVAISCGLAGESFLAKHLGVLQTVPDFEVKAGPSVFFLISGLILVAALVLSIVISAKKKRGIVWFGFAALAIATFATNELFANMTRSDVNLGYVELLSWTEYPSTVLSSFGVAATSLLALVISIVFFVVAALDACNKLEPKQEGLSEEELAKQQQELEETIRRIVKEEIEKRPEVIQNFYGVRPQELINNEDVAQEVKEEPKEQPKEEPKEEPKPEPQPEPQPEPVVAPVEESAEEKAKIIRIPFDERLVAAEKDLKDNYNELKNEILAYGVKSRISNSGDTFRLHRKAFVKITIAGKGLKLYFALNPADYAESTIPVIDASDKNIYEETPLAFKVKSNLSVKRAKQLIADVMATENLTKEEPQNTDWVKQVRKDLREEKKAEKEGK